MPKFSISLDIFELLELQGQKLPFGENKRPSKPQQLYSWLLVKTQGKVLKLMCMQRKMYFAFCSHKVDLTHTYAMSMVLLLIVSGWIYNGSCNEDSMRINGQ